jgi:phosphopantetheinyl transferase (holo-ACP synthase)
VTPAVVERTIGRLGVGGILNDREREVYNGFALEKRRRDWIAGRLAAKRAVRASVRRSAGVTLPYAAITIWNDATGGPRVAVDGDSCLEDDLNVSLAHADGAGVAAVARTATAGSVGVDIEGATSLDPALIRRVMGAREIEALGADGSLDPLAIWTAKEAAYKASAAVCSALRDVELTWSDGRLTLARIADARAPRHHLGVRHRTVGGYTMAVALYRPAA